MELNWLPTTGKNAIQSKMDSRFRGNDDTLKCCISLDVIPAEAGFPTAEPVIHLDLNGIGGRDVN
jgi:hypothetical protein